MKIKSNHATVLIELAIIGMILFPVLYISMHAIPVADDFTNAVTIKRRMDEANGGFYIIEVFKQLYTYYMSWGGYYFSFFITSFFQPFMLGGLTGLRLMILLINMVFYGSLGILVSVLLRHIYGNTDIRIHLGIYMLVLPAFANHFKNTEVLAWYCVSGAYVLVVACLFWGVIFFVKALTQNKTRWTILASIFGFMVSGGALNIAALNCGLFLLIGVGGVMRGKKKTSIICFASALCGALVNASAPGNFVRHENINPDYPVIMALKDAANQGLERFQDIFLRTPFCVLLVILLVISIKYIKDETGYQYPFPLGVMLVLLSGIVVVNFPVCLGYAGENYFPERCIWIEDCTIYIVSAFMVFYISGWLKRKKYVQELSYHAILCIVISCVLFTCDLGARRGLNTYPLAQMASEIARGNIREYSRYWEQVLYEIAHSQDDEVTIVRSWKPSSEFLYEVGISDDKDLWVNAAIAEFYGKESVSFIIQTD